MTADDERAIRNLIFTYARAADRLDGPLLRTVFADDAEIDLGSIYQGGPAGFEAIVLAFMGSMTATRHSVTNVLIAFPDARSAVAESYVSAWHRLNTPEGECELTVLGRYLNRAERCGEGWLLTHHSEVIDWGERRPVDSRWFEENRELDKGRRDRSDRSYRFLARSAD